MSKERFLFFLGDKLNQEIKDLKENGKYFTPEEVLIKTGLVLDKTSKEPKLKEVLMPSDDDRPETEFIEIDGISVPSSSVFYQEWPQTCKTCEIEVCAHCHKMGSRKEFWVLIKNGLISYECVRDDSIPWSDINIIPSRKIDRVVVNEFNKYLDENFPNENVFFANPIRHGNIILNYTIRYKNKANTVADVGLVLPLSQYLFDFFDKVLLENLWFYAQSVIHALEPQIKGDVSEFLPTNDLFEE